MNKLKQDNAELIRTCIVLKKIIKRLIEKYTFKKVHYFVNS
jgi:hypothetical protein